MKVKIVNDDDINTNNIEIFYYEDINSNVNILKDIFSHYRKNNKRYTENYSEKSLENLISENRFSYGFILSMLRGEPFSFFGISEHDNWLVVSRFISFQKWKLPITTAYMIPKLEDIAKNNNKNGVIFTFNEGNKKIHDIIPLDRMTTWVKHDHIKDRMNHEIYKISYDTLKKYKNLENPVVYKYTKQYITYYAFDGSSVPKF